MALEIEGKLMKLLPVQTGEGSRGPWTKQDFVLETFGEYPKKVCFSSWNEKAKDVQGIAVGSPLKITFAAESREYNERWYTDLRAFNIATLGATQPTGKTKNMPPPVATEPESEEGGEDEENDLPF